MKAPTVYVLFTAANGISMGLTSTVYAPYLLSIGLTAPQIMLVNAVFFLTIVLAELPTGMLADGRGRVWSLRVGAAVYAVSHLCLVFADGLWTSLACEVMMGIAFALLSGAQQAWITDALIRSGEGERLRNVLAASAICMSGCCLAGGMVGALIGAVSLRAAIAASVLGGLGMVAITLRLMGDEGEPVDRTSEIEALRTSFAVLRRGNGLVWAMAAACSFGLVLCFNHYWAVFFGGMTGQAGLSLVWPVLIGGNMLGAYLVKRGLWDDTNEAAGVVASFLVAAAGMAFIGSFPGYVMPLALAFIHEMGRGALNPLLNTYVLRRVDSSYRATFGSLQSFVSRMGCSVILVCVWFFSRGHEADPGLIPATWLVNGTLMLLAAGLLWAFRPKRT